MKILLIKCKRHHNNKGYSQINKTADQVDAIARRILRHPTKELSDVAHS